MILWRNDMRTMITGILSLFIFFSTPSVSAADYNQADMKEIKKKKQKKKKKGAKGKKKKKGFFSKAFGSK